MSALYKLVLRDRPYLTTVRKKITDGLQIMINDLGMQHSIKLENDKGMVSFWDINATIYVAAVTSQTILNDLRIAKPVAERRVKLGWVRQLEHRIDSLRRKISQISVVLRCMEDGEFTSHQKHLKLKFKKMFGSGRKATLAYKLQLFKHELRACSETLKYKHKQINRKTINYRFSTDPKSVYRRMREKKRRCEKSTIARLC